MTPSNRQNIKKKRKLFRFLPSAVNVKYKPFDISPLAGERISVLFEIGVSRPQYLYYVMRASYYQNTRDLSLNYLIFEGYTLKWTISPWFNVRPFWFQYNFMSAPLPPRLSAPNSTFGQLSFRDQKPEDYSQLSQLSWRLFSTFLSTFSTFLKIVLNFPSEIKSLKIILRQKQELDVWMRARCCANRFVSGWRD